MSFLVRAVLARVPHTSGGPYFMYVNVPGHEMWFAAGVITLQIV
jgi:hypothetical protein